LAGVPIGDRGPRKMPSNASIWSSRRGLAARAIGALGSFPYRSSHHVGVIRFLNQDHRDRWVTLECRQGGFAIGYPQDLQADVPQQLGGRFGDFVIVLDKQDAERSRRRLDTVR
jgi:hypothetical protein